MNSSKNAEDFLSDLWNGKALEILSSHISTHAIVSSPLKQEIGHRGLLSIMNAWFSAFPNAYVKIVDTVSHKHKCALKWTCKARHEGTFCDVEATGKWIEYSGATFFTFDRHDLICEYSANVNIFAILTKFGIHSPNWPPSHKRGAKFLLSSILSSDSVRLSEREAECLALLICGMNAKASAKILSLSYRTVEKHHDNIRVKMKARSQSELKEQLYYQGTAHMFQNLGNQMIQQHLRGGPQECLKT